MHIYIRLLSIHSVLKPYRPLSPRIHRDSPLLFGTRVERTVADDCVLTDLVFDRHGTGWHGHRLGGERRRVLGEPTHVGLTGVWSCGRIPVVILDSKGGGEGTEPPVVPDRSAGPDGTGVIAMRGLVARLPGLGLGCHSEIRAATCFRVTNVLGSPKQLNGFEEHLDDMAVAVRLGCGCWIGAEKEDVHGTFASCVSWGAAAPVFKFTCAKKRDGIEPTENRG